MTDVLRSINITNKNIADVSAMIQNSKEALTLAIKSDQKNADNMFKLALVSVRNSIKNDIKMKYDRIAHIESAIIATDTEQSALTIAFNAMRRAFNDELNQRGYEEYDFDDDEYDPDYSDQQLIMYRFEIELSTICRIINELRNKKRSDTYELNVIKKNIMDNYTASTNQQYSSVDNIKEDVDKNVAKLQSLTCLLATLKLKLKMNRLQNVITTANNKLDDKINSVTDIKHAKELKAKRVENISRSNFTIMIVKNRANVDTMKLSAIRTKAAAMRALVL